MAESVKVNGNGNVKVMVVMERKDEKGLKDHSQMLENLFESVIENLEQNYEGCDIFETEDDHPLLEIQAVLSDIEVNMLDFKRTQLVFFFLEKLLDLNCFCYRVYSYNEQTDQYMYWNPLETSFLSFKSEHKKHHFEFYQQDTPYPTKDMIRNRYMQLVNTEKLYPF